MTTRLPHVLIVGGGFGGLQVARGLARAKARVTLIDRRNHHLFQPLLYEVAMAALSPADIASPLRRVLRRQRNCTVLLGEAVAVDVGGRRLLLADDVIGYDYLVLATGATHSYFGHDEWARHAPGLKSIEDALEIRRRVLTAFEAAEREPDEARRRAWLTFVVIGGGPTGVELAGALAELSRRTLARDFRRIDPAQARVILVEGVDRILPTYPPRLSEKAAARLRRLGVDLHTRVRVSDVGDGWVQLGDERLPARTLLWSAGVRASSLARSLGQPLDRAGRVPVMADLTLPGRHDVFVIGDLAALVDDRSGQLVPGLAPAAIQEGRHVARGLRRALRGDSYLPFHYVDKGTLATIGRSSAVARIGRLQINGFVAWLLWVVVHIAYLIGFRNRVSVLLQWAWRYLTWDRGARLITGEPHPQPLRRPTRPGAAATDEQQPTPTPA